MLAIRMDILGTRELDFAISKMLQVVSDWRPLWPTIRDIFRSMEESQFASQGAKGNEGRWRSLDPSYKRRKAIEYPGTTILVRTGRLLTSLAGFGGSADSIYVPSPTRLALGTRVPYAYWLHKGTTYMPSRKVVDFTDRQNLEFAKAFQRYVNANALKGFDQGGQRRIPFGVRV